MKNVLVFLNNEVIKLHNTIEMNEIKFGALTKYI
jgi:hypothetical protein